MRLPLLYGMSRCTIMKTQNCEEKRICALYNQKEKIVQVFEVLLTQYVKFQLFREFGVIDILKWSAWKEKRNK